MIFIYFKIKEHNIKVIVINDKLNVILLLLNYI
jgi:hypothetical protein